MANETSADEAREKLVLWMGEHEFATGHGDTLDDLLGELAGQLREREKRLWQSIDYRLNEHLCEMKEGWDDSIVGFNDAYDIVRKFFREKLDAK